MQETCDKIPASPGTTPQLEPDARAAGNGSKSKRILSPRRDILWFVRITLIGGPTALLEIDGFRVLTDPTFDPPGSEFTSGPVTLRKTVGPALQPDQVDPVDVVLLSHDQHFDNLDGAGKSFLPRARQVLTTASGAMRLGGNARGLLPWEVATTASSNSHGTLTITATPARHGPPGIEPFSGDVTGFVIQWSQRPRSAIYVSGDTVWYEGVAEVARRFAVEAIVLFAGAARVAARGPFHLTMNREDAISTARAFPRARIYPVHHNGWQHFSEDQGALVDAFAKNGLGEQLRPLQPGVPRRLFE